MSSKTRPHRNNPRRRSAGFSILELLLVLVILSILAGIVGMRFTGQSKKAKVTAAKSQMDQIKGALTTYNIMHDDFPTTQQGLEALWKDPGSLDDWEPLLDNPVKEDQWGNPWQYRSPGTHNTFDYDLHSWGPDGQDGTDDDVKNWSDEE